MRRLAVCLVLIGAALALRVTAQSSETDHFSDMRWRLVGPHRGVNRSDDGGATWRQAGLTDTKFITGLLLYQDVRVDDLRHEFTEVPLK